MKDPFKTARNRDLAIKGISLVFNAAAVVPLLNLLIARKIRTIISVPVTREIRQSAKLPDDHPAAEVIRKIGQSQNIKIDVRIKNPLSLFKNMGVTPAGATAHGYGRINRAIIIIEGDPLSLPGFPDTLAAIAAHEIAHMKQMDEILAQSPLANNITYAALSMTAPLALINSLSTSAFLLTPVCLGIAAGMYLLRKYQQRNNEMRADLMTGQLTGSFNGMIKTLEHIKDTYTHAIPAQKTIIERLTASHPAFDTRLAYLRRAQEMTATPKPN